MQCPYCAEDIKDNAIACRYCQRDFFVIQPLMAKLKDANDRIKDLERKLKTARVEPDGDSPRQPAVAQKAAIVIGVIDDHVPTLPSWAAIVLTYVILVGAHFLIVIQFDLPLLYLRLISIALPLIFGFLYRKALDRWLFWDLVTGLVVAAASILTMSVVVAQADHVPILPQDAQGWREYAEYAVSIGFGFFTGCVLRHGLMLARTPSPKLSYLVELIARFIAKKMKAKGGDDDDDDKASSDAIDAQIKKIESLVSAAIAAGSVAVSIYTGLSGFLHHDQ